MNFCLTYEGPLPATAKNCVGIKHQIRKKIHEQLKDLIEEHGHALMNAIGPCLIQVGGYAFIPLVIDHLHMVCELDITFLRRERAGSLISKPKDEYGGDLDNRLKIFFDALRAPRELHEVPTTKPDKDEAVMYCLLEDDALITKFQVDSGTLLGKKTTENQKDVRLVTKVTVKLSQSTPANRALAV